MKSLAFIFEDEDWNGGGIKDLEVWARDSVDWDEDNSISLTH